MKYNADGINFGDNQSHRLYDIFNGKSWFHPRGVLPRLMHYRACRRMSSGDNGSCVQILAVMD